MARVVGQDSAYQASCNNCGATVQYTQEDVRPGQRITDSDIDYDDYRKLIICPQCNKAITVSGVMPAQEAERFEREHGGDYDL